jgi:hypothetical protein
VLKLFLILDLFESFKKNKNSSKFVNGEEEARAGIFESIDPPIDLLKNAKLEKIFVTYQTQILIK